MEVMGRLVDEIERYLKSLLAESPTGRVEIQRNALALRFRCVPSQINYVLMTRFTLHHGFYVESRRGGGGFLRISRVPLASRPSPAREIFKFIGEVLSEAEALAIVERLEMEGLLSRREAMLVRGALSRGIMKVVPSARDKLRASLLRAMLAALFGWEGLGQKGNGGGNGAL